MCDPRVVMESDRGAPERLHERPLRLGEARDGGAGGADVERRRAKLAEAHRRALPLLSVRGAGLKREVKECFHECGVLIIEGYGLTECSPTLTLNRPDAFRFDTVGKPIPERRARLAEDGEILARGPSIFSGYHKDPTATKEAFTDDGWFKTGDVGRFTEDGFLRIIDRKKDILVTAGGKNVPPANIEQRFADDPFLAHVVVYGDAKRYLVAGVWVNDEGSTRTCASRREPARAARRASALVQQRIDAGERRARSPRDDQEIRHHGPPLTIDAGHADADVKVRRKKVYEAFRDRFEAPRHMKEASRHVPRLCRASRPPSGRRRRTWCTRRTSCGSSVTAQPTPATYRDARR